MPLDLQCWALFCDDIRPEMGGKQSLIGVYRSHAVVKEFPFYFPKIGVFLNIKFKKLGKSNALRIPKEEIHIRIYLSNEILLELSLPNLKDPKFRRHLRDQIEKEKAELNILGDDDLEAGVTISISRVFAPIEVSEPSSLKVRVAVGEKIFKAGALSIVKQES